MEGPGPGLPVKPAGHRAASGLHVLDSAGLGPRSPPSQQGRGATVAPALASVREDEPGSGGGTALFVF